MSRVNISPESSKSAVNRAGTRLANGQANDCDLAVIENWRAAHNYILNTFQSTLRTKAKNAEVRTPVQRIKRLSTIQNKLMRFPTMQLARMHDIVGCRVIFETISELGEFRLQFNNSRFSHKRRQREDGDDSYDYIQSPKTSGYRGIHDVFEYKAKQSGATKTSGGAKWNGLNIEIQYRTAVQHAWATAVEICDQYTDNHGKFSNAPEDYLSYFQLASELLARQYENMNSCLPDLSNAKLIREFNRLEIKHGMLRTLEGVKPAQDDFEFDKHTLLIFNQQDQTTQVQSFKNFRDAVNEYFRIERQRDSNMDTVLVAADDGESVRFGFSNYFSDAREFVSLINRAIESLPQ